MRKLISNDLLINHPTFRAALPDKYGGPTVSLFTEHNYFPLETIAEIMRIKFNSTNNSAIEQ